MSQKPPATVPGAATDAGSAFNRHTTVFVFVIVWVVLTAVLSIMLYRGDRGNREVQTNVVILGAVFTSVMVWYLSRTGPSAVVLPDLNPLAFPRLRFWGMLGLLVLSLLIGPTLISILLIVSLYPVGGMDLINSVGGYLQPWMVLEALLALVAIRAIFMWHQRLTARLVVLGLAAGLIAGAAQWVKVADSVDPFDIFWAVFQAILVPPVFIAGGLLLAHTGIGRSRSLEGKPFSAVLGFLAGCVLYLPLALVNTVSGAHAGYTWMDTVWKPLSFSWLPAIAEESWARLFLVTLCYALLRPTTNDRPHRAVIAAVLLSATAHGLVHGLSLSALFITGLVYLLPMAVLFVKRDWEHAVGAHYVVNLIPFLAVFLGQ